MTQELERQLRCWIDNLRAELAASQEREKALGEQLEHDRTLVADCITKANRAIDSRHWLTEGRGPYEWNDDRWHEEFYAAAKEIKAALEPMAKVAADWSSCPRSSTEIAQARIDLQSKLTAAEDREKALLKLLNTPEVEDFDKAIPLEAAHQIARWGAAHDAGKNPEDWFWLVGYLAGKALASQRSGDVEKAKHHCISTAAALRNWHAHIRSGESAMRPGISVEKASVVEPADIRSEPLPWDETRCRVCGWPLANTADEGCVKGNCSMRPGPAKRADAGYAPELQENAQ